MASLEAKYRLDVTWVYALNPLQWMQFQRLQTRFPPAKAVRSVYFYADPDPGIERVYIVGEPQKFDARVEWVRVLHHRSADAHPVYVVGHD